MKPKTKQHIYIYQQDGIHVYIPSVRESNSLGCVVAFLNAAATVGAGVLTFFVVYFGYLWIVQPLLYYWSHFLLR